MAWPFSTVGAPNFDSGVVSVPTSATNIPNSAGATCWLLGLHVSNPTTEAITLTITDASANVLIPPLIVPAGQWVAPQWQFMPAAGIMQWTAGAAGLKAKVWGYI